MRCLLFIMTVLFTLSGCIFTPPPSERVTWTNVGQNVDAYIDESDPILRFAKAQLGVRYRYGGMSPSGFDCSGFICYVYEAGIGKKLPRTARAQSTYVDIMDIFRLSYVQRHGDQYKRSHIYFGIENIPGLIYWLNR